MELEKKSLGEIKIDNNVLGMLAKNAALEVEGVVGIVPEWKITNLISRIAKGEHIEGVIVSNPDEYSVAISLKVKISYGYNILDIARKIQVRVKNAVENFANLDVDAVNIIIQEVVFNGNAPALEAKGSVAPEEKGAK